jgi:hypothetical protein
MEHADPASAAEDLAQLSFITNWTAFAEKDEVGEKTGFWLVGELE